MTTPTPPLHDRWILHFTHVDNLPSSIGRGALLSDTRARMELPVVEVGDPKIKWDRRGRSVPCGPQGLVGDYVPFYFAPRSPMMYRIACDRRDSIPGRYQGGDRPLVYLASKVGAVLAARRPWVGSDGNAAAALTAFTDDAARLGEIVDWRLMEATLWNSTHDDPDRQRRRAAEFLVHEEFPTELLLGIATYSEEVATRVRAVLAGHPLVGSVTVRPDWYYGYECRG